MYYLIILCLLVGCATNQPNAIVHASSQNWEENLQYNKSNIIAQQEISQIAQSKLQQQLYLRFPTDAIHVLVDDHRVLLVGETTTNKEKITQFVNDQGFNVIHNYLTISKNPTLKLQDNYNAMIKQTLSRHPDVNQLTLQTIAIANIIYFFGSNIGNLTAAQQLANNLERLSSHPIVIILIEPKDWDFTATY